MRRRQFILFLLLLSAPFRLFGQSDNLISKGTGAIHAVDDEVWVFDSLNLSFSRINLFSSSPEISNVQRENLPIFYSVPFGNFVAGYSATETSAMPSSGEPDTLEETFSWLRANEEDIFLKLKLISSTEASRNIHLTGMVRVDSLLIAGYGTGGYASIVLRKTSQKITAVSDSVRFNFLAFSDTLFSPLACAPEIGCDLSGVDRFIEQVYDTLIYVDAVGAARINPDSILLFLGSHHAVSYHPGGRGLRRGWLGSRKFQKVKSMGLDSLMIDKIFINPFNRLIWVFTRNAFFVSSDLGLTFKRPDIPRRIPGRLIGSLNSLEAHAAAFGDTTIINFNFPLNPGLVYFVGDSMLVNPGKDEQDYPHYFEPKLSSGIGKDAGLNEIAFIASGEDVITVAGSRTLGIFYLAEGDSAWQNLNRQRKLEEGLQEVITFPTVFNGETDVRLGYHLSSDCRVSIRVFNYAMEAVRTIVEDAPRSGGGARSENPNEDRWDGKDDFGNHVSTGLYYIRIKTDKGKKGWGKVMVVYGRN